MIDIQYVQVTYNWRYVCCFFQEFGTTSIKDIVNMWDNLIDKVVGNVKKGIELFRDLISGKIDFEQIITNFVTTLEQLPGKVGL